MKNLYLFIISLLFAQTVFAQIDQISLGANYADFNFYRMMDGDKVSDKHTSWDIAFDVSPFGSGVFVNEAIGISFTTTLPEVELYLTGATDFASVDTMGMARIQNSEESWEAGAFNHVANENNPLDYGWGAYDTNSHQVLGTRIFVIKLRNGEYKKMMIESLAGGVYTLKYADLDGADETVQTIDKADYEGKTLAYLSIENDEEKDLEPAKWDILFTQYSTVLTVPNGGGTVDYHVTGILANHGVKVAQADNVDPMTVTHEAYVSELSASPLNIIGHDWKSFQGGWTIAGNRAYFIKTLDDEIWKVEFIDFEGSTSGIGTFEKTFATEVTSVKAEAFTGLNSFDVFPVPARTYTNVAFDLTTKANQGQLVLSNSLGQTVFSETIDVQTGLNIKRLALDNYPTGQYFVSLQIGDDIITRPLVIQ